MLSASLVIASCGLSTVLIINAAAKQSYASNNTFLIKNVQFQVVPKNTQAVLSKQDYVNLRKLGFTQLIAVAQASTHMYINQQKVSNRRIDITGIDTIALLSLHNVDTSDNSLTNRLNHQSDTLTSIPFSRPVGIVHPSLLVQLIDNSKMPYADSLLDKLSIPLSGFTDNTEQEIETVLLPTVLSIDDPSLGNDLITDIGEFFRLFPSSKLTSLLFVSPQIGEPLDKLIESLEVVLPSHLQLVSLNKSMQQDQLTDSFHINLLAMALLMFVVCLFIVINAVNLLVNARMPWFKICRQLGFPRQVIFASQIYEIVLITFLASCVGIYLSIHVSNFVAPTVQATLEGLYGVEVGFGNTSLLSLFLQVFGISVCGSIAATFAPFSLSNQNLHSTIVSTNSARRVIKWGRVFWTCSFSFALLSISILVFATSLWLLMVATASLILSGCCLLLANYPRVINVVLRLIPSSFVMLRISAMQSSALSSKTKVACCAFFIAATSNIGMNLMVDSFRGATVSWLESRLATDYYLYYDGYVDVSSLGKNVSVEVFHRAENTSNYKGTTLQQFSYPIDKQFKDALVFYKVDDIETAWKAFSNDNGIFVNQQFFFEFNLGINDKVRLEHPSTKVITDYVIQGIVYDFGNAHKQVLLPISQFNASNLTSSIYSINTDAIGIERFKIALNDNGINTTNTLLSTTQLLTISTETFDRTFLLTDGLNIVTLLVAALSLACAIVVLMNDARPQNMLLRTFGVSAVKTQLLALHQYLILCVIALVFATPFGILLSWVLIFKINLQAFQWTYPLQIDALKILQIYGVSLGIVLFIIAIPIIKAGKRPLIEDIRWLS